MQKERKGAWQISRYGLPLQWTANLHRRYSAGIFTLHISLPAKKELVCDLQGVLSKISPLFELTDPVIHFRSRRQSVFGRTDLGRKGIDTFFSTHRCSSLCSMLNKRWFGKSAMRNVLLILMAWRRLYQIWIYDAYHQVAQSGWPYILSKLTIFVYYTYLQILTKRVDSWTRRIGCHSLL